MIGMKSSHQVPPVVVRKRTNQVHDQCRKEVTKSYREPWCGLSLRDDRDVKQVRIVNMTRIRCSARGENPFCNTTDTLEPSLVLVRVTYHGERESELSVVKSALLPLHANLCVQAICVYK